MQKIVTNPDKFLFIVDFDKTMTQMYADGEKIPSISSTLGHPDLLGEKYQHSYNKLKKVYAPIEDDESLDPVYKKKMMLEWWEKKFKVFQELGLSKVIIKKTLEYSPVQPRTGLKYFLEQSNKLKIPVIVISASSFGEVIPEFLKQKGLAFPNQIFVVNKYIWDKNGIVIQPKLPFIHSMNKDQQKHLLEPYKLKLKNRKKAILVGDRLSDLDALKNFKIEDQHTYCFIDQDIKEKHLDIYKKAFTEILDANESFDTISKKLF